MFSGCACKAAVTSISVVVKEVAASARRSDAKFAHAWPCNDCIGAPTLRAHELHELEMCTDFCISSNKKRKVSNIWWCDVFWPIHHTWSPVIISTNFPCLFMC